MVMSSINWGIIGCGDVAEHKSGPALYQTPGSHLIAVMRRDAGKAEDFAHRHGAQRWYTDVPSLLADPEVNAVYIASPHYLHLEHVTQAAEAGKIVLCEKPMGVNSAQAQQAVAACALAGVPLTTAYYRRFWPIVQKMKELLAGGAIGEVVSARLQLADYSAGDTSRPWLTSLAQSGGGALANGGSHWIDLARHLLGDIEDVCGLSSRLAGFEVDDTTSALLRTRGGVQIIFSATWRSRASQNDLEISGTQGRMVAAPLSAGRLMLYRSSSEPQLFDLPRSGAVHSELIRTLIPLLLAGRPSPVPGEEAVAVWRIMEASYRSSDEGRRCRV